MRDIASPQPESRGESEEVVEEKESESPIEEKEKETEQEEVAEAQRVLVAHPVSSTTRMLRETFENFSHAEFVATADPLRAFELALQKSYSIFIFGMQIGELTGPMLYELISTAYKFGREERQLAPGIIFIREKEDPRLPEELDRDVRVKDVLTKPLKIERLLNAVSNVIDVKDPTAR